MKYFIFGFIHLIPYFLIIGSPFLANDKCVCYALFLTGAITLSLNYIGDQLYDIANKEK